MGKLVELDYYDEPGQATPENSRYLGIQRGPRRFILDITTGYLYERVGADHINKRVTAEQVEDKGLIRIVLDDSKAR